MASPARGTAAATITDQTMVRFPPSANIVTYLNKHRLTKELVGMGSMQEIFQSVAKTFGDREFAVMGVKITVCLATDEHYKGAGVLMSIPIVQALVDCARGIPLPEEKKAEGKAKEEARRTLN